jgi:hypothetical protein
MKMGPMPGHQYGRDNSGSHFQLPEHYFLENPNA